MNPNSGFYRSINGDRQYDDVFLASWIAAFITNGVYKTELQVVADENMRVILKPGRAWINGRMFENPYDRVFDIDLSDGALNRYTTIVLRHEEDGRAINPYQVSGAYATTPTVPALTRDADNYEMMLCKIYVAAGQITISQADIADTRLDPEVCGIVTGVVDQVDTTQLYAQIEADLARFREQNEADFLAWVESIKDVLDENAAGNLLLLIEQNTKAIEEITPDATASIDGNVVSIVTTKPKYGPNCNIQFDAPADFAPEHTYKINGVATNLKAVNGEDIDNAWKEGAPVTLVRRGYDAFFNSGGNPLKIRVRGGLTAPANGKDGDIWVKTDYPLSGRVILGYHGLSSFSRVAGDVHIALNATATPGNPLQSMGGTAKLKLLSMITGLCYWDGTALVRKVGFRVWANGVWAQPFPYFYNNGIDYLGDFGIIGTVTAYIDTTTVYVAPGYWSTSQWAAAGLSGGIETGNLKSVRFNFSYGAVGYQGTCWASMMGRPIRGGGHIGTFGAINGGSAGNTTFSALESNVETAEGIGYPCIGINGGNTGGLTGLRLSSIVPTYL